MGSRVLGIETQKQADNHAANFPGATATEAMIDSYVEYQRKYSITQPSLIRSSNLNYILLKSGSAFARKSMAYYKDWSVALVSS